MGKNVTISTLPNIGQNYLPKINSSSIFANSLVYDDGSSVLINTTTASAFKLDVNGSIRATSGTLTGALSGTSATFTSSVNILTLTTSSSSVNGQIKINNGTSGDIYAGVAASDGTSIFTGTTAYSGYIGTNTNTPFYIVTNGTARVTIAASTGAATFSSFITAASTGGSGLRVYGGSGTNQWDIYLNSTNLRFSDNTGTGSVVFDRPLSGTSATFSGNLNLQGAVTRNINFYDSSNTNINAQIQYDQIASNSGQLFFGTNNAGTFATRLTIANTGAATFSSSVTAGGQTSILYSGYDSGAEGLRLGFDTSYYNAITGTFSSTAANNRMAFVVNSGNGTRGTVMTLLGSGNVGIGTTSVTNKLIVVGSETGTQITTPPIGKFVNIGNTFSKFIIGSDNANYDAVMSMDNNATLANTKLRIYIGNGTTSTAGHSNDQIVLQGNGNVGIGTSSPSYKLDVLGTDGSIISNFRSASGMIQLYPYLSTYGGPIIQALNGSGSVYVPLRFEASKYQFDQGEVLVGNTDNGAYNLQCNGTGVWGAGAYVNGSDILLKENILDIEKALDLVLNFKPKSFQYKEDYSKDRSTQTGFIAQDLLETLKDQIYVDGIVSQGKNHLNVAYQNLIPLLTKAIQELKAEIDTLKK